MRRVEIDSGSGFCGGVIRAIGRAEKFLEGGGPLYSLGAIVHNEAELERLGAKGLFTVEKGDIEKLPEGATLFIRAHGEPPDTYKTASSLGLKVIDCTCPVVLKLQKSIREAYSRLHSGGGKGNLIIFGKIGHAEVLGLLGQVDGDAVVIENLQMLEDALASGLINPEVPMEIFSQTTKSPSEYEEICRRLSSIARCGLEVHETICSQVANRHKNLSDFAGSHDVIIFVSGRSSSNGKVLFDLCRSVNPRSYHIVQPSEIDPSWLNPEDSVGVCGATSTPKWLLESVAESIQQL